MENVERKLHLGCFDQILPGWINTDITPHIFISRVPGLPFLLHKLGQLSPERYGQHREGIFSVVQYLNVTNPFPYEDGSIDHVYCSHLIEHLHPDEAEVCVREAQRVLKPSGIFRVSTPDLDRIVEEYNADHPDEFLQIVLEAQQKREKNRHHWLYNEASLHKILIMAGFGKVYRRNFREGICADVGLIDNRPNSLFIEAVK